MNRSGATDPIPTTAYFACLGKEGLFYRSFAISNKSSFFPFSMQIIRLFSRGVGVGF